ncbi:hypothetical protein DTO006G1_7636 [Penicillium roqueforti]|nr:hypothetical protein CBS147337_8038 [Penicillium roqueforti]KAI2681024.1 hypothetical protein LCP963914a_6975 [Penicillium roqueforti]KAI2757545.1 hypothetical protein DTO006G1_7636 [Penicillium roqueforti]KAI3122272.1 hypothetical protein CBS147330_7541 [Penicillium roqueforti]KAI3225974.1 hypothetical protein DTO012A9_9452 [Penicillium roqueforti]
MSLPPAEKLPLALRKNIRDTYESAKETIEANISKSLSVPWTIEVNPLALYPYADSSYAKDDMGAMIVEYFNSAASYLNNVDEFAKTEINKLAPNHVLSLEVDSTLDLKYNGVNFNDGNLRIVVTPKGLGVNIDSALESDNMKLGLNEAAAKAGGQDDISYIARDNIGKKYDPVITNVKNRLEQLFGQPFELLPNFEDNFAKVKKESQVPGTKLPDSWETNFGATALEYFESLATHLDWNNFGKDDLLKEGFLESVDKGKVALRVVDKLEGSSNYNEAKIEDGVLYLQTKADTWGVNTNQASQKIVDLL